MAVTKLHLFTNSRVKWPFPEPISKILSCSFNLIFVIILSILCFEVLNFCLCFIFFSFIITLFILVLMNFSYYLFIIITYFFLFYIFFVHSSLLFFCLFYFCF